MTLWEIYSAYSILAESFIRCKTMDNKGVKSLYLVGKGGVGKSTCSVSLSIASAERGKRTLIVSLDPAHNLSDIFGKTIEDAPTEVGKDLFAIEVDLEARLEESLKRTAGMMKNLYRYLNVINLEGLFDTLRFSPGMEEYAVLITLEDIFDRFRDMDMIIFDTPPTGLTLRFFTLPSVSILWIDRLMKLRERILKGRASIKSIKDSSQWERLPSSKEEDPVFKELIGYKRRLEDIRTRLSSRDDSLILLVVNPDRLSFLEGRRIIDVLRRFSLNLRMLIINKKGLYQRDGEKTVDLTEESFLKEVKGCFKDIGVCELPFKDSCGITTDDLMPFGRTILRGLGGEGD